jgi:xanthosine utilization system XapX-like protein
MQIKSLFCSSRFIYVQEGIAVGLIGAFAKVLFPSFPIIELYGFLGPIIGLAFGLKTYGHIKANENNKPPTDGDDIPVR